MCVMRTERTVTASQVGARVKGLIASQERTRSQVADELHISEPALGRRLRGEVPFNVDELHALARIFEVPIHSILGEVA